MLPVDGKTIPEAYLMRVDLAGDKRVFRVKRKGTYQNTTWNEMHAQVLRIFEFLRENKIGSGDKVCIMSQSRPEWIQSDIAIQAVGAIVVPIYHSSSIEDISFILDNCEAKLVFAEDAAQVKKLAQAFSTLRRKIPVVVFEKSNESNESETQSLPEILATPANPKTSKEFENSVKKLSPDSDASIVYTSGTTGQPKGVVLIQENFASELRSIADAVKFEGDEITLTFLPFAHILGRVESYFPIYLGLTLAFAESINVVAQNIQEIQPSIMVSVPRIYEKIYTKIQSEIEAYPDFKKNIAAWALKIGRNVARIRSNDENIPLPLLLKFQVADRLVLSKIRQKLGGKILFTISGGAPLSPELCEVFHACGIKVLEGYGLTETTAAISVNLPARYEFGTVGPPLPGMEVRIAEDGEIQVRSKAVFKCYYKNEEATRAVFTEDGWFCTGDIGKFTARGSIKITDRKKELIVTSGGKKIAPQKLENLLKGCRFISNGLVYGDKQKFLVALLTLNEAEIISWAKGHGIVAKAIAELSKESSVCELIESAVKGINTQLASYESIKKFRILPQDFTIENGELTPSMKIKRKICVERYRSYIDEMYA